MSPASISLRILRFHNCEGCVRKVGIALHQIDGVELVEFDPVSGNVTVSTSKHPEVIRYAIERKTRKQVIILSHEINHTGPNVNVQELAETLLRLSHAQGLNNIELVGDMNSNSFRLNLSQRFPDTSSTSVYTGDADYEFLEPSLRTISRTSDQVYGYPPEIYGLRTTPSHDHQKFKCCTIL